MAKLTGVQTGVAADIIKERWLKRNRAIQGKTKDPVTYEHLAWMCGQISLGVLGNDQEQRWLGFIQGVLVARGVVTIEQMREVVLEASKS